jgi:hypothetical protein
MRWPRPHGGRMLHQAGRDMLMTARVSVRQSPDVDVECRLEREDCGQSEQAQRCGQHVYRNSAAETGYNAWQRFKIASEPSCARSRSCSNPLHATAGECIDPGSKDPQNAHHQWLLVWTGGVHSRQHRGPLYERGRLRGDQAIGMRDRSQSPGIREA